MLRIGITGGIGTGKSYICNLFRLLGIPTYLSDIQAKKLCEEDFNLKEKIIKLLGDKSYTESGKYNREYIASEIFVNPSIKNSLESLIHPAVLRDSDDWFARLEQEKKYAYALKESALLYESGSTKGLDKIIVIDAPMAVRIERIFKRDHITKEQVLRRMESQWPNEKKLELADYIIVNDGVKAVIPQVIQIHRSIVDSFNISNQ